MSHPAPPSFIRIQSVAIVVNPSAGKGHAGEIARAVADELAPAGVRVQIIDQPMHAAESLPAASTDAIVTVGGDGTLRATADRCLSVLGDVPPLLPLPLGTANLMCRYFGVDRRPHQLARWAAASILRGQVRYLDAAQANGRLFFATAGVGLDAAIVHALERRRRGPIAYASYVVPAVLALAGYRYHAIEVRADDALVLRSAPAMAFIGNIRQYGTGFSLTPAATPDDGLLDVCVLPIASRGAALAAFLSAAAGEHLACEGAIHVKARRIEITAAEPLPVQLDGDAAGHTPLSVRMLDRRIGFVVPVVA